VRRDKRWAVARDGRSVGDIHDTLEASAREEQRQQRDSDDDDNDDYEGDSDSGRRSRENKEPALTTPCRLPRNTEPTQNPCPKPGPFL